MDVYGVKNQRMSQDEEIDEEKVISVNDLLCRGKIQLQLDHTIWLRQVQIVKKLASDSTKWTPVAEIRSSLLNTGLAIENTRHGNELRNLCDMAGIPFHEGGDSTLCSEESPKSANSDTKIDTR